MLSGGALIPGLQAFGGGRAASGNTEATGAPTQGTGGGATAGAPGLGLAGQGTDGGNPRGGSGLHMPTRIRGVVPLDNWGVGGGLIPAGDPQMVEPGGGGRGTNQQEFGDPGRNGIVVVAYRIA